MKYKTVLTEFAEAMILSVIGVLVTTMLNLTGTAEINRLIDSFL